MDDYKDHPVSITERKANDAGNGSLWTPRDALISVLRDIDSGIKNPASLVIIYRSPNPERSPTAYRITTVNATPDAMHAIGLVEEGKLHFLDQHD